MKNASFSLRTYLSVLLALSISGCASTPRIKADPEFKAAEPKLATGVRTPGSLYQAGQQIALFEDKRARQIGDIINVLLVENTAASKQSQTGISRSDEIDLENPTIMGNPARLGTGNLGTRMESERSFSGSGSSSQSNSLNGNIAVTVYQVLPNGYLKIRGEKRLILSQGSEYIRLSGIVRVRDVTSDNTVLSTQIADALISYRGKGALNDANRKGWLSQFFTKVWPF